MCNVGGCTLLAALMCRKLDLHKSLFNFAQITLQLCKSTFSLWTNREMRC